jgi:hypothetical protein
LDEKPLKLQLSEAPGAFQSATAVPVAEFGGRKILAGQLKIEGFCASGEQVFAAATVIENEQVEVLPLPSRAVYVTTVVPMGQAFPELAVEVSVIGWQPSATEGASQVATANWPVVVKFWFVGQPEKTGPATSPAQLEVEAAIWTTETLNWQVCALPSASVAT